MGPVRWLLAALTVSTLGCSSSGREAQWKGVEYYPKAHRAFAAVPAAPQAVTATDAELNADGYIQLGTVLLKSGSEIPEAAARSQLAVEGAARGAGRFRIVRLNGDGGARMQAHADRCYSVSRDSNGRYQCDSWAYASAGESVPAKVTQATLWRHDPEQAAKERPWWQLMSAVASNHPAQVEALLKQGQDPNVVAEGQLPVLIHALQIGNPAVVEALVKGGVDLRRPHGSAGNTLLNEASLYPKLLKTVLAGADLEHRNGRGETPLMFAALAHQPEATALLLAAGASANATTPEGRTPLVYAVDSGDIVSLKLLLQKGASANAANQAGMTPLMFSARGSSLESTKALLDGGARIDAKTPSGMTALMFAAAEGKIDQAEMLLDRGADANAVNTETGKLCCTPLAIAKTYNHRAMAALLGKHGAADANPSSSARP